eukprot:2969462-Amphidinium_carterae.1
MDYLHSTTTTVCLASIWFWSLPFWWSGGRLVRSERSHALFWGVLGMWKMSFTLQYVNQANTCKKRIPVSTTPTASRPRKSGKVLSAREYHVPPNLATFASRAAALRNSNQRAPPLQQCLYLTAVSSGKSSTFQTHDFHKNCPSAKQSVKISALGD